MAHLILIPICIFAGWLLKRSGILPENSAQVLGSFVIYVSLPSLILANVPSILLEFSFIYLALMPWLVFGISIVFFYFAGRFFHWTSETRISVTLCCGLGNTSFVGLPVLRMFYGEEVTSAVLIADQFGTFLCLAIPGFLLAVRYLPENKKKNDPKLFESILKRLFTFPPFLALLFSFFLRLFTIPEAIHSVFKTLGETLVPIALFTVGFQLRFSDPDSQEKESESSFGTALLTGLIYKLLFAPILIFLCYFFLKVNPKHIRIAVLEAGMAPMITASVVALQMGFRPVLSAAFPGIGLLFSIPTLFLFYSFLENFF
ncbi:AEC family transporter [Leptospira sp. 201903070]|uniref:AEC family transporter n=1 Tax=Leptospira ainlahdjerensis TaxID=2810033 RepID=A0ABS2UB07_9LEPT|nr:AEC family transporter [Leptospira ainlahdjerensis]MBM9577559.1 AEC family transporter [Leptospira ainlahdjerensis]